MPNLSIIAIASALTVSFAAAMTFMAIAMSGAMGDWHMGMTGGRGSDPVSETPVVNVQDVSLRDFAFSPANVTVDVGVTVTWTNYDRVAHTVTSDRGNELDSELFGQSEAFHHTFEEPGEFSYYCEPHPNMKGLVTVRP